MTNQKKMTQKSDLEEINEWLDHIKTIQGEEAMSFAIRMLKELSLEMQLHYVRAVSADRRTYEAKDSGSRRRSTDV